MAVTQKQIAEEVGVTQQLVALALRDHPRVAEDTRRKIKDVAQRLGYHNQMNRNARSMAAMRHGKRIPSGIVGVILEPAVRQLGEPVVSVPYFMALVDGVESEAGRLGLDVFLMPSREGELPWLIRDGIVDGVIFLGAHTQLRGLEKMKLPLVTLGCRFPKVKALVPDDTDGIRQLVKHLADLGHRQIAFVGLHEWQSARERREAFVAALAEYSLPVHEEWLECSVEQPVIEAGAQAAARLLKRVAGENRPPFTAIVCHNDPIAIGVCRALQKAGWRVPDDISVTGFDDVSLQYNATPPLTSIGFARFEMGERAVRLIQDGDAAREKNGNRSKKESQVLHETVPVRLVVRQSTGPARGIEKNGV